MSLLAERSNLGQPTVALAITRFAHNCTPGRKVYEVNFKESGALPGLARSPFGLLALTLNQERNVIYSDGQSRKTAVKHADGLFSLKNGLG